MKEKSIKEDIKILKELGQKYYKNGEIKIKALSGAKYIWALQDLLSDYKRVLKENEELKSDNLEYQRIQDIFDKRTYRKKYLEERRKEEPNLLYPDADEIYRRYYELQKENQLIYENYISKQKIKDKIEELKKEGDYRTADNPYGRIHFTKEPCDYKIQVLKELLESEDSKDGEN